MLLRASIYACFTTLLLLVAGCHDPIAPWSTPPDIPLRPAVIEEWFESVPQSVQRGTFTYNDAGQLVRYDFGRVAGDGSHHVTMFVLYEYDGLRLTRSEVHARDIDVFRHVRESEYTYDGAGRLAERLTRSLHEKTGALQESRTTLEYDGAGRLAALVSGNRREAYSYDPQGNVSRHVSMEGANVTVVFEYAHESSFNPFPEGRERYLEVVMMSSLGFGPYNISRWSAGAPGEPPGSVTTVTHELNAAGYPIRRHTRTVNSAAPGAPINIVSTFQYLQP